MHDKVVGYLPILTWMPRYRPIDFLYDAVSGVTVALTLMPQAIAYASLAGLDPLVSYILFMIRNIISSGKKKNFKF